MFNSRARCKQCGVVLLKLESIATRLLKSSTFLMRLPLRLFWKLLHFHPVSVTITVIMFLFKFMMFTKGSKHMSRVVIMFLLVCVLMDTCNSDWSGITNLKRFLIIPFLVWQFCV